MTSRDVSARAKGLMLLALALALASCSSPKPPMNELQREDAERQALIEAMKRHPAFNEAENGAATGKPIDVPITIPPKAAGSEEQHEHPPSGSK